MEKQESPRMHTSHRPNMSPNTLRRLLTAHGRTTTPGIFEAEVTYNPDDIIKEHIDRKKGEASSREEAGAGRTTATSQANTVANKARSDSHVSKYLVENSQTPKQIPASQPVSKKLKPGLGTSHSFYTRPFKVHGKEAWENAMRGLGSVDTLLNKYGYVEPGCRGQTHPAPSELVGKASEAAAKPPVIPRASKAGLAK